MTDPTPTPDTAAALRTPDEWSQLKRITVHGPDGWRRDGKPWAEPISEAEFMERAAVSSCEMSLGSGHPWADTIRSAVLGPTPNTAAPLPYTGKLKAAVYEATAVLPPKVGEFMSEYFRRCAYWAGQGIEDGDLRDEPLADEVLALAARSVAGTPTPPVAVTDDLVPAEAWQAVEDLYTAHRVDLDDFARTAISVAFSAARSGAGTAALTEDLPTRAQVWDVIATVRDAAPRQPDDADTDDIIDALVDRGYLRLAGDGGE